MNMATIAWICATLMVTSTMRSEALPFASDYEKQALISILLQSPPVAEAACFVKDVTSAEVILHKICDCDGSAVACDVGPVKIGDIEVTFCNKQPNQPLNDLLLMKYACDVSAPNCGKGKSCHIGPIEYNNKNYYLCTRQTGLLAPSSGQGTCRPAKNPTQVPGVEERRSPGSNSRPKYPDLRFDEVPDVSADKTPSKPTQQQWNPAKWAKEPKKTPVNPTRPVQTQPPVDENWPPMMMDDNSWWNMGKTLDDPRPSYNDGGPGVHVYERRRWRVGNKGGEVIRGKRPSHWHHHDKAPSASSSEED